MTASILVSPSLPRGLLLWAWLYISAGNLCGVACGVLAATRLPHSEAGGPSPLFHNPTQVMTMVEPHHDSYRAV